jgi:hypothetical protein
LTKKDTKMNFLMFGKHINTKLPIENSGEESQIRYLTILLRHGIPSRQITYLGEWILMSWK